MKLRINDEVKDMKINILGTDYEIKMKVKQEDDKQLENRLGYENPLKKQIVIADIKNLEGWKDEPDECIREEEKLTLRHEIIHAFFEESGLSWSSLQVQNWSVNEEMVDWIAIQFPKILKAFKDADCL